MQMLNEMRVNERKLSQAAEDLSKINWPKGLGRLVNRDLEEIC